MEYQSGEELLDSENDEQQLPVQEGAHDDAARESTDSEALPAERCKYQWCIMVQYAGSII